MRGESSLPPDYFERMFAADRDPWGFESSEYEASKYDVTLAALNNRYFSAGFEIGCANGVLTKRLALQCRTLLAIDVSVSALAHAKARCVGMPGITFSETIFPAHQPSGVFDLIVMSEVAYYWSEADIAKASKFVKAHLIPGGELLLVHWIGETDYPQSGDAAANLMWEGLPQFDVMLADRYDKYRLDLWRKP